MIPKPSDSVLIQLASLIVHIEEAAGIGGHTFDLELIKNAPNDPNIKAWINEFPEVLLPRKRTIKDLLLSAKPKPRDGRRK